MKKLFWVIFLGCICLQLAGCSGWLIRTSVSEKPRVDQEISGNRGFISGEPSTQVPEPEFTSRKVYQLEVELPQWQRSQAKEDKELWGNRGYIHGQSDTEPTLKTKTAAKPTDSGLDTLQRKKITPAPLKEEIKALRNYEVKKGDTLQKISQKFYGTTKKWTVIYKANKDILASPDKLKPGQTLIIPQAEEFKK